MPEAGRRIDLEGLFQSLDDEPGGYTPAHFDLATPADLKALRELFASRQSPITKRDELLTQVRELLRAQNPGQLASKAELDHAANEFLARQGRETYGTWVYYPWRRALVRVLPAREFRELRTHRNRYQITEEEQARLSTATLGIVGLSAGHAVALCLALEGVGSRFRLADFDRVELSNMNRVLYGVTSLGLNKAVQTARQLYEIDPYLEVVPFAEGITDENIDAFMGSERTIDLLVEECDDLYMKVRLREEARARGIPVVMETNDRGLLDVERFDIEPARPVFHGLLDRTHSDELKDLDTEGKVPFMLRILGSDMSPRLAASLVEIDRTITGWPQLASGNMLGGAVVTDTARRVLLGAVPASGRYRVDFDELVGAAGATTIELACEPELQAMARTVVEPPAPIIRAAVPSRGEIDWLVGRACLAPSGGNDQPWRFSWRRSRVLDGYLDRQRSGSFLDYERSASYLALGAAAENLAVAATGLGRHADIELFPEAAEQDLVFRVTLGDSGSAERESPLLPCIDSRVTNRRLGQRLPLDASHARKLEDAARERGAELVLVTDPETLTEIGALLGAVDRFRFLCEPLQTAMMSELRFSAAEAASAGDGIDVATLELDAVGMAGLRLLANEKTAKFLRSLGKGIGLEQPARRSIAAAAAVGLLSVEGVDASAHVHAGRAMQAVWLWATHLGLAMQPMAVAPYLFARLIRGRGDGFTSAESASLHSLYERFLRIFPASPGRAQPMLFRLAHAPAPRARALRRSVDSVLSEV